MYELYELQKLAGILKEDTYSRLERILMDVGYNPDIKYHLPRTSIRERSAIRLDKLLRKLGFKKKKYDQNSFIYDIDGAKIVFSYKTPETGLFSWFRL